MGNGIGLSEDRRSMVEREMPDDPDRDARRAELRKRYIEKVKLPQFFNKHHGEVFTDDLLYLLQLHFDDYIACIPKTDPIPSIKAKWIDYTKSSIVISYDGEPWCTLTQ